MTTSYFYPDQDGGGDSVDGSVYSTGDPLTWAERWAAAGDGHTDPQTTAHCSFGCYKDYPLWSTTHRIIMTFPTNPLPLAAIIDEAKVRVHVYAVLNELPPDFAAAIFESFPNSYNYLVAADYQHIYTTPISDLIYWSTISKDTFITFVINDLTKIVKGGVTKLGLREALYEAPCIEPPWIAYADVVLAIRTADWADSNYHPRLEVTWHVPVAKDNIASRVLSKTRLPTPSRLPTAIRVLDP